MSEDTLISGRNFWPRTIGNPIFLYLLSTWILLLLNVFYHVFFLPIRAIAGLLSLVLIPGYLLEDGVFHSEKSHLGRTFVVGLAWSILIVNGDFLLATLCGEGVPLLLWLVSFNTILVIVSILRKPELRSAEGFIRKFQDIGGNHKLLGLLVVALAARTLLAVGATGSLSPDGSLYAEYARSIVEGRFVSQILGDNSVLSVVGTTEQIVHQGFSYVFALSWLMVPPTSSGPIFILLLEGTLLLLFVYQIALAFFSEKTAFVITSVIGIHPLFIFHSAIGYGPEITSLIILVCAGTVLLETGRKNKLPILFAGVLIGLVEAIWYPNYYLACILIPIATIYLKKLDLKESLFVLTANACLIITRALYRIVPLFYLFWGAAIALASVAGWSSSQHILKKYLPYFSGIFVVNSVWRFPQQIAVLTASGSKESTLSEPIVDVLLSPANLQLIYGFFIFLAVHVTIPILTMALFSLQSTRKRASSGVFILLGILAALGTFSVFSLIRDNLEIQYLFSDSRFFLFITLMGILASGVFLEKMNNPENGTAKEVNLDHQFMSTRRAKLVLVLLVVGMIPGYLAVPSGIGLTKFETRYGWSGLSSTIAEIGNEESTFLVDRARELSWFTGRRSVVIDYSANNLSDIEANNETMQLAAEWDAEYIVIDDYFMAKWQTLKHLYKSSIEINDSVILDTSNLAVEPNPTMQNITSLKLLASTQPNEFGRYTRIFEFSQANYTIKATENLLGRGWEASNNGSIIDSGGKTDLIIGKNTNTTTIWRPERTDLLCTIESGFIEIRLSNMTANVTEISIVDTSGNVIDVAEPIDGYVYCSIVGGVLIGDIRIDIHGDPGESITIDRIAYWNCEVQD